MFAWLAIALACNTGSPVAKDGTTDRLFPKSPLSEAPCLEDQDCVVTHRKDGHCCPDAEYDKRNLYTRDQYQQLVDHQDQICVEGSGHFTCPEHPPPGHIETVFHGACIESRCTLKAVPAEAPHSPTSETPTSATPTEPNTDASAPTGTTTPTVASPKG